MTVVPEATGVDIGGNVTLPCEAKGFPMPEIYWQKQDGSSLDYNRLSVLPSGHLFIQGRC